MSASLVFFLPFSHSAVKFSSTLYK